MVLGKLQVPVQGPIALVIGAGGGCWTFLLSSVFFLFSFSLSLGDGPI